MYCLSVENRRHGECPKTYSRLVGITQDTDQSLPELWDVLKVSSANALTNLIQHISFRYSYERTCRFLQCLHQEEG